MGHIAEALKKAEWDRAEKHRRGSDDSIAAATVAEVSLEELPRARVPFEPATHVNRFAQDERSPTVQKEGPAPGTNCTDDWPVDPSVVALTDKTSSIVEQYRAVRTWMLCRAQMNERACVAVTSSVPREGKTITTANLAVVMAEIRRMRVLAVDCDLRLGALAGVFGMQRAPGLVEVLSGRATLDEAIRATPLGNLSILPAGHLGETNPTELLNSTAAVRVFDEIRERFHYTLVDTPPVQRVSDVGVIGALCSGVVMVVRMHKTATHLVRQSVQWLQSNNLSVMGCIATGSSLRDAIEGYRSSRDAE